MSGSANRASTRGVLGELPWHPVVLAAAIVVSFWIDTAVSPFAAFRALGIAVAGALLLTAVASLLLRSPARGGLVATAVIGLLWSKQLVRLGSGLLDRMDPLVALLWIGLLLILLLVVGRLLSRRRRGLTVSRMTGWLNGGALLLLAASVLLGVLNGRLATAIADLKQGMTLEAWTENAVAEPEPPSAPPDIYAILLDGYPRADVLEFAFGIDNRPLLDALEERGFDVADAAHSDYLWTHVSVPSALNMAYIEQIPALRAVREGQAPQQPTLRRTIFDNEVFAVARGHGYTTVAVASGFEEVTPRGADVWVDGGQLNELELNLLVSTWLGDLVGLLAPDFASGQHRDRILHNLEVLRDIAAAESGPKLVIDHVPAPHAPIVFEADGDPITVPPRENWYADSPLEQGRDPAEFVSAYRGQLPYLNARILAGVDAVLAASDRPPVIVLFADHGSASAVDWTVTQPGQADPARLLERTGILFAALTPERDEVFPEDVSPVDLFRLLFDAYLGTEYGRAVPPEDGGHVPPVDASVLDAATP